MHPNAIRRKVVTVVLLSFLCRCFHGEVLSAIAVPRIAVIGGGAGGSSVAYYISQLLNNNVEIDVYDEKAQIGGRLATANILGNEYETGGSVIHPRNKLAVTLVESLGLSQRQDTSSSPTSLLKDSEFVFSTSSWTFVTIMKIISRYGFEFLKLQSKTSEFITAFENIYDLQDKGLSFDNVENLLTAMDPQLLNLTKSHFGTYLRDQGFREQLITELVQAIMAVNYGQTTSIHSLVGHVSVAGAANGLWSVQKGNKMLPRALLNNSVAKVHLNTRIGSISSLPSGSSFKVSMDPNGHNPLPKTYDKVILAIPLAHHNSINFINFLDKDNIINKAMESYRNKKYHRTVSTLVAARDIKPKYKKWMDIISCTPNFFTSISRVHPVVLNRSERVPVFKVFSPKPLTDDELEHIFEDVHQVDISDWLAYPEYDTIPPPLPSFIILPNIYYLNAIEWAASSIETSLISGRNAAIHIASQLTGLHQGQRSASSPPSSSSSPPPPKKPKTEF